ncbi:hypothetical protein WFJ45_23400, partial [Salmonella enterica subsp. enterica serovar Minnesota]
TSSPSPESTSTEEPSAEPSPSEPASDPAPTESATESSPADPTGDDQLVGRFEAAGYTEQDAQALAEVWGTSAHTAKVLGALVLD